jgi:transposase
MADTEPGEVAENFGRLGLMWDPQSGRKRQVWGMIIVLGYSRYEFLMSSFGQQLVDVVEGLEATWAFFSGIPLYLVLDNFPAAVLRTRLIPKGRQSHDLQDLRQQARRWCLEVAGRRVHGTRRRLPSGGF